MAQREARYKRARYRPMVAFSPRARHGKHIDNAGWLRDA